VFKYLQKHFQFNKIGQKQKGLTVNVCGLTPTLTFKPFCLKKISFSFLAVFIAGGIFFAAATNADEVATTTAPLDFDLDQTNEQIVSTSTVAILPPTNFNKDVIIADDGQQNQNENLAAQNATTSAEIELEPLAETTGGTDVPGADISTSENNLNPEII